MANLRDTALPASGSTDWYGHYSAVDQSTRGLLSRGQLLDSFDGASDDAKLTAAMSWAAAQTYPPPILLGAKRYQFQQQRTLYDGFTLLGVPGMSNAEIHTSGAIRTEVNTPGVGGAWLTANGGNYASDKLFDVCIRNIGFTGSKTTQFMASASGVMIWAMNLRDCSWSSYGSVLGSASTRILMTLCIIDGWIEFQSSYYIDAHVGGSDNNFFMGMSNIDGAPSYMAAPGQYHLWFDDLNKTYIGPMYVTAEAGWNGLRITGPLDPTTNHQDHSGGPIWIYGAKFEGHGPDRPSNGALVRQEGGIAILRDCWFGYAMASPSTQGHSPADAGVVHQTAGELMIDGGTYDRASSVGETVPFVYSAGGESSVTNIWRTSQGGVWSGRPRTQGVTRTDSTTTAL